VPNIHWALFAPAAEREQYGCYCLDSWNGWFGPTYAQFLEAKRQKTGEAYPELDADDLQRLQVISGEILRPLCIDSKACVVITDTIAGKGLEEKEDNEVGRIVPISASGLEYFVDVLVESELRVIPGSLGETCIHRVIKSNNRAFPIGLILENPTFSDYLAALKASSETGAVANAESIQAEQHAQAEEQKEMVPDPEAARQSTSQRAEERLRQVLAKVESLGYTRENLVTVANQAFGKYMLSELTEKELAVLDQRLDAAARKKPSEQRQSTPGSESATPLASSPTSNGLHKKPVAK